MARQLYMYTDAVPVCPSALGAVPIDRSGLRFAHCRYHEGVSDFVGVVKDVSCRNRRHLFYH